MGVIISRYTTLRAALETSGVKLNIIPFVPPCPPKPCAKAGSDLRSKLYRGIKIDERCKVGRKVWVQF
jgi:hypothetical protein